MPTDSPDWEAATDVAPIFLGSVSVPQGSATGSTTFAVPGTATALRIVAGDATTGLVGIKVVGTTTGCLYLNLTIADDDFVRPYDCPVAPGIDGSVTVTVTLQTNNPGPGAVTVAWVIALGASGVQGVYASALNPLPVLTQSPVQVTNTIALLVKLGPPSGFALSVANITASVVSGTPDVLVAGVAGKTITVYGYEFFISATSGGTIGRYGAILDDTTAATIVGRAEILWQTAAGNGSQRWSRQIPYGLTLPVGAGLQVAVPAGSTGAVTVNGAVDYTQG